MNAPALRPRSVGEILDLGFQLYRSRWVQMATATGLLVMPLLLLQAVAPVGVLPLLKSDPPAPRGGSSRLLKGPSRACRS